MDPKKSSAKTGTFSPYIFSQKRQTLGLPGNLNATDEIFPSAEEMHHAINSFLRFLDRTKTIKKGKNSHPELFGFITKTLKIQRSASVQELQISSDLACGTATIQVPELPTETAQQWSLRRDQILSTYWPTLQDAQIRATLQLYRALSQEAREQLQTKFTQSQMGSLPRVSSDWMIHSGPTPCVSSKRVKSGKNSKS